jgi:hypothetical protein
VSLRQMNSASGEPGLVLGGGEEGPLSKQGRTCPDRAASVCVTWGLMRRSKRHGPVADLASIGTGELPAIRTGKAFFQPIAFSASGVSAFH